MWISWQFLCNWIHLQLDNNKTQNIVSDVIYSIFAYLIRWLWRHSLIKMAASMAAVSRIVKSNNFLNYQPILIIFHQINQSGSFFSNMLIIFCSFSFESHGEYWNCDDKHENWSVNIHHIIISAHAQFMHIHWPWYSSFFYSLVQPQ